MGGAVDPPQESFIDWSLAGNTRYCAIPTLAERIHTGKAIMSVIIP
jgi:hypothetical protein